jgi:cyclopropane fatty-acyl-phospholipid synthase-like methyltransferase
MLPYNYSNKTVEQIMELINDDYKRQLQEMHATHKKFSRSGGKKLKLIERFITQYTPTSVIDFGCSHGELLPLLVEHYSIRAVGYDPGVVEFENIPTTAVDCLTSTDVLEHVEPEMIDDTLKIINTLFTKSAFLLIASYPAKKSLPDGRNAHLIIESFNWWKNKLETFIDGKIVRADTSPITRSPKKGPTISGHEYIFVIEK